jgi:hypothetical protein
LRRSGLRIAVGVATAGRCSVLAETLAELARQTRLPDALFVCPAVPADFDSSQAAQLPFPVYVVGAPRGSTAQRNAILDATEDFDTSTMISSPRHPILPNSKRVSPRTLRLSRRMATFSPMASWDQASISPLRGVSWPPTSRQNPIYLWQTYIEPMDATWRCASRRYARIDFASTKICHFMAGRKTWTSAASLRLMALSSRTHGRSAFTSVSKPAARPESDLDTRKLPTLIIFGARVRIVPAAPCNK